MTDLRGNPSVAANRRASSTSDAFYRPSLTIELDTAHFSFDHGYLAGPGFYRVPSLRVYIHETIHFWQTLNQGYLTNLAQEEWLALLEFEKTGRNAKYGNLQSAYTTKELSVNYSTADLVEGLARFWDIMILGPDRLEEWNTGGYSHRTPFTTERQDDPQKPVKPMTNQLFDRLMQLEDAYAAPFRLMLEQWGTNNSIMLFPLVGHFSMQTPKPAQTFAAATEALTRTGGIEFSGSIHDGWRHYYAPIRELCHQVSMNVTGSLLTSGWDVVQRGALGDHPLFRHFLALYDRAVPDAAQQLDLFFAVPGDPEARGYLRSFFVPPLVLFHDGRWAERAPVFDLVDLTDTDNLLSPSQLADTALDLNFRFRKMRRNQLMEKFGGVTTVS